MEPQVDEEHYRQSSYDTKERFCSYWHQLNEIMIRSPKDVLEIGCGNGFLARQLTEKGVTVSTLDIDPRLHPDYVGSVTCLPFDDDQFDTVVCYEVLEHLPVPDAITAISEIHRVCRSGAIISLPDPRRYLRLALRLPRLPEVRLLIGTPGRPFANKFEFDGEHYWEIGRAGHSLRRITRAFEFAGFTIRRTYRVFENPYHRFFVLDKASRS